jgi:hypothetical protein
MRTRVFVAILLTALWCAGDLAQSVSYFAFEQITVANSAVGFTSTKVEPDGSSGSRKATLAECRLETAEIRWRIDGLAPTTTVGTLLEPGDQLVLAGHDVIMRFQAIRTGATSGVLSCNYSQ